MPTYVDFPCPPLHAARWHAIVALRKVLLKDLVTFVLLALRATLLSACDPTTSNKNMSPDDCLTHNISIWDSVVSRTEPRIGGERGAKMLAEASESSR